MLAQAPWIVQGASRGIAKRVNTFRRLPIPTSVPDPIAFPAHLSNIVLFTARWKQTDGSFLRTNEADVAATSRYNPANPARHFRVRCGFVAFFHRQPR
jgi:hypothetical protein